MPDLKSELAKIKDTVGSLDDLSFDDDEPSEKLEMTNNNLYAWIAENPGCTATQMKPYFKDEHQLGTRLSQGSTRGFLTRKGYAGEYTYFRTDKHVQTPEEKVAMMNAARLQRKELRSATGKTSQTKAQASAVKQKRVASTNQSAQSDWDADTIIDNLGLKQAKALYEELKKYFGA